MEKLKLLQFRKLKGLTQLEMAILANMDQTTYGRKENGLSKITSSEWKRFATILDVSLKEIFEEDNNDVNDISVDSELTANTSEYFLERLKEYIRELEDNNEKKQQEIDLLKEKIFTLTNGSL